MLYFGQNDFDKVFKRKNGKVGPAYGNLKECQNDCRRMRRTLTKFGIGLRKKYNYYLDQGNNTAMKCMRAGADMKKRCKNNPDKRFLFIFVLAGHGILQRGEQILLVNEFSNNTKFYKVWPAEADIRKLASTYSNSYCIAFFACCREVYNAESHSGCIGGSIEDAERHFKEQDEKIQLAKEKQTEKEAEFVRL